jgi:hypothetical protein
MEYICICKNKSSINFDNFKRGSRCKNCEPITTRTKYTFESVLEYFKNQGCVLISEKYINNKSKLDYICICGNKASSNFDNFKRGNKCGKCKTSTFTQVQEYFKENGCELLSKEYKNTKSNLEYICECGNKNDITFGHFKEGRRCTCKNKRKNNVYFTTQKFDKVLKQLKKNFKKKQFKNKKTKLKYICKCGDKINGKKCQKCRKIKILERLSKYFKKQGCKLLTKEYIDSNTKLEYMCNCGNKSSIKLSHFKSGSRCMECCIYKKLTFDYVFEFFKSNNCILLSKKYINIKSKLNYICKCGEESSITFNNFKYGKNCKECGYEKTTRKTYNYKEFTFPSGKTRKVQGYEHFILKELLKIYSEEQILTDRRDVPKIEYYYKQKRRYYPDIFIPHLNKVIEVKSFWTLQLGYVKNMLKSIAAKKNFDYEIWIYNEKDSSIHIL